MTAQTYLSACGEFLSSIEEEEVKLLAWGVVEGSFLREELEDLAETFLRTRSEIDLTPDELIEAMIAHGLLFKFGQGLQQFRSRMAESVRLFANLRQILEGKPWQTAPTLVADFRFSIRPRVYPRRHINSVEAFSQWRADGVLSSQRQLMLKVALGGDRMALQLSQFQVRATSRILRDVDARRSRGVIVTVGTGSGKTLAFYLPALTHLATLVTAGEYWTKSIAVYPRNELLKDQFSEAYVECRRYDEQLISAGARKLTIGAFFGQTPWAANTGSLDRSPSWKKTIRGYICPFLRCPRCGADLVWSNNTISAGAERLECASTQCDASVEHDEVMLTRQRMRDTPPDVLFTTTETLNRRLSDSAYRKVFGVGVHRRPQLVLLDEVHTYHGTSGAQAALLFRRWRHAVGGPLQFTGLSATLRNATEFFATLTGLNPASVEEITPGGSDLERQGMEYMLAVRSDPASRVSVLSTSIQSAMLLGRVLDTREDSISGGLYGRKVFAFTDDLDVTNRFYHSLLDAEGWNASGTHQRRAALAGARSRTLGDHASRFLAGQSWRIAEDIGHPEGLATGLRIGRTSSQDTGVDDSSDIIVATASLELGFNDPDVGGVLQHKAPLDAAAFLQRKGRAGRPRPMRPWTVIVLSDYGRDRVAYQSYDSLFDPELAPRNLPVANRHVLRMQAVYSLMEWIALRLSNGIAGGSVFDDFSGPATTGTWGEARRERQRKELELLTQLASGDAGLLVSLRRHLREALQVDEDEVSALLWEPPRAVLTAVVPTILRRLRMDWQRVVIRPGESSLDLLAKHPLPDFLPATLFSDLSLPEVQVVTQEWDKDREDGLPILQALNTLSPGAVTRRFAVKEARASHWIPIPSLEAPEQRLVVNALCETFDELGVFQIAEASSVVDVRCIRPLRVRLEKAPSQVLPSSNARPHWHTQIIPNGSGMFFDLPEGSPWHQFIQGLGFYVHNQGAAVEVRRFSTGSDATILFRSGQDFRPKIQYKDGETGRPAGMGFAESVDGLQFTVTIPAELQLDSIDGSNPKLRGIRAAFFRDLVLADHELEEYATVFQRDRLQETYLSALTAWALSTESSLEVANRAMNSEIAPKAMAKVLAAIFRTLPIDWRNPDDQTADDNAVELTSEEERQQKAHTALLALCNDPSVLAALKRIARVLWMRPDDQLRSWAEERLKSTLGAALLAACRELYPEADTNELVLDLNPGPRAAGTAPAAEHEIWITETTLGGGGVLEEILRRFASDPRRFFRLAESALAASDFELVDVELTRILNLLPSDRELASRFEEVRRASSHSELQLAVRASVVALEARGVQATHSVISALYARVLRPSSGSDTDQLLRELINRWQDYEERLGVEVDIRVFAYLECGNITLDAVLARINPELGDEPQQWRLQVIQALMWPRGHALRGQALDSYNPYHPLPEPDRHLLLDLLNASEVPVSLASPEWRQNVVSSLAKHGVARVSAPASEATEFKRALLEFATEPVEVDYLEFYPQVEGLERGPEGFTAMLYLRESVQ